MAEHQENPLVEKLKKSSWSSIAKETIIEIERLEASNKALLRREAELENELTIAQVQIRDYQGKLAKIKGSL